MESSIAATRFQGGAKLQEMLGQNLDCMGSWLVEGVTLLLCV